MGQQSLIYSFVSRGTVILAEYTDFTAVNYHKWSVCKCALKKGRKEGTRVYQFLKGPLTRAFGEEWYAKLEIAAEEIKRAGIQEE